MRTLIRLGPRQLSWGDGKASISKSGSGRGRRLTFTTPNLLARAGVEYVCRLSNDESALSDRGNDFSS